MTSACRTLLSIRREPWPNIDIYQSLTLNGSMYVKVHNDSLTGPANGARQFPNNLPEGTKTYDMSRAHDLITPEAGLDIDEIDVPIRDDNTICIRRYRKSSNKSALPLFVYMHGGGYVTGGLETDDSTCRVIASEIDIVVVSIEYRLAPEHRFPVGFTDSFDVVRWIASKQGQLELNVNLAKGFILGGTSAGGNFTSGISHLAVQEGLSPKITGVVFLASNFCHPDARPAKYLDRILSIDEIDDAPGLTRKSIDYFAGKPFRIPSGFHIL